MRKACKNERIDKGVRTGEIISERNEANLASVANARSNKVTLRGHQFEPCTPSMHTVLPDDAIGCPWGGNIHTMERPRHDRLCPGQGEPSDDYRLGLMCYISFFFFSVH